MQASDGRISRGTVYTTLYRMKDKGFVRSSADPISNHPGLPRPHYRITALGKRALRAADLVSAPHKIQGHVR